MIDFDHLGRVICAACQSPMKLHTAETFDDTIRVEYRCEGLSCAVVCDFSLPYRRVSREARVTA